MTPEEKRAQKARALRYKKPIVRDLTLETITQNVYDMQETCYDVQYGIDGDDGDEIISAMLGDEDEAIEFKMMFSSLSSELEQFVEDIDAWEWREYIEDYYDLFMVNGHVADDFGGLFGYDAYEGDYFGFGDTYEEEQAEKYAFEKLKKELTKDKMLTVFKLCMKVFTQYLGLQYRYDCLEASLDILKERNVGHMKAVREITELYDLADRETYGFKYLWKGEACTKLDKIIRSMPQEAFL